MAVAAAMAALGAPLLLPPAAAPSLTAPWSPRLPPARGLLRLHKVKCRRGATAGGAERGRRIDARPTDTPTALTEASRVVPLSPVRLCVVVWSVVALVSEWRGVVGEI